MTKYLRGSEWRKWDLHIHSNASDGSSTPEEIINEAKKKGLSVVALTDHHTVDNIDEIKRIANRPENNDITVISGIEFRSEYGAKSVHFIGLFPDSYEGTKLDGNALRDLILSPLGISKTTIIAKGRENKPSLDDDAAFKEGMFLVQVDLKEAAKLIHRCGGIVSIHNGSKSSGLDAEVKHQGTGSSNTQELYESLGTLKKELLKNHIDICEIRKANDSKKFYLDTYKLPSIIASDAHKTSEIGQNFVWIKADPTFDGLKQILYEPEDRVRIQEGFPETKSIYQLIDSVTLSGEKFWNQTIPLNENLSVIIGGRSTGKSTLLESIARRICPNPIIKIYDSEVQEDRTKFIEKHLDGISVIWKDKGNSEDRTVDYFPQSCMYEIAKDQAKVDKLVATLIRDDSEKATFLASLENEIETNADAIIGQCTTLVSLHKEYLDFREKIETSGNVSGINQEIELLQNAADSLKQGSGMSDEEYIEFGQKQDELSQKKAARDTLNKDKIAVENLKNKSILNPAFRYEFKNLSETRQPVFEQAYDTFASKVISEWNNYIDQEIKKFEQEIAALSETIQNIEKDPIYLKGVQYIATNKQYSDYQEKIGKEKEKLQEALSLIQKRDYLLKQITNIKQEIIKLHLEFREKTKSVAEKVQLVIGDLSIAASSQLQTASLRIFLEPKLRKKSDEEKQLIDSLSNNYETDLSTKLLRFINGILDGSIVCRRHCQKSAS